jgi:hypothetical protein
MCECENAGMGNCDILPHWKTLLQIKTGNQKLETSFLYLVPSKKIASWKNLFLHLTRALPVPVL